MAGTVASTSVVSEDFVVCMRGIKDAAFTNDVGDTSYLKVPTPAVAPAASPTSAIPTSLPSPANAISQDLWFGAVIAEATRAYVGTTSIPGTTATPIRGELLVFIHGYNNDQQIIMQRHRQLRSDLAARGFNGAVVSFDWPSSNAGLEYLSDRVKASAVAVRLVNDLVFPFVARVRLGTCVVNVHVLAHSTGAYLFQETVDMSDENHGIADVNWTVSQLLLIGADIDQHAMEEGSGDGESMINHATRVTNYSNPYDDVLKLSNAKRLGLDPRIGRVGLPSDTPENCVNVNCGDYFAQFRKDKPLTVPLYGDPSHSWHIGDPVWTDDLYATMKGDLDRNIIPTRKVMPDRTLSLEPDL